MATDLQARVVITAVDHASKTMSGIAKRMGSLGKKLGTIGAGMAGAGVAITSAVGGLVTGTVVAAANVEEAMLAWKKTADELKSPEAFKKAYQDIDKLSEKLPLSHTQLINLASAASRAGVKFAEVSRFVELTAMAASAFEMSVEEAGPAINSLAKSSRLSADDLQILLGVIDQLENSMNVRGSELIPFMNEVGALGRKTGFTNRELAALGATVRDAGIPMSKVETSMRNLFKTLSAGDALNKNAKSVFKELQLDADEFAKAVYKNPVAALGELKKRLDENVPAYQQQSRIMQLFKDQAAPAIAMLFQNWDQYEKALNATLDPLKSAQQLQNSFNIDMEGFWKQLTLVRNMFASIVIEIGQGFLPYAKQALEVVKGWVTTLRENPKVMDWLVKGLVAIAGVGAGLIVAGGAIALIGAALTPLAALASVPVLMTLGPAILAIAAAFKHWDVVGPAFWDLVDAGKELLQAFSPLVDVVKDVASAIGEALGLDMSGIEVQFEPLLWIAESIGAAFELVAKSVRNVAKLIGHLAKGEWKDAAAQAMQMINPINIWEGVKSMAEGRRERSAKRRAAEAAKEGAVFRKSTIAVPGLDMSGTMGAAAKSDAAKIQQIPKNSPLLQDSPDGLKVAPVRLQGRPEMEVKGQAEVRVVVEALPGTNVASVGTRGGGANLSVSASRLNRGNTGASNLDIGSGP